MSRTNLDRRIAAALELMMNPEAMVSGNASLAEQVRMSESNFCHLFKQETGFSPHRYLLQQKMIRARDCLLNGQSSIAEIARMCGFADRYTFSKAFKKFFGATPASIRK
jgi:AraC family transcriptional regulator